MLWYSLEVPHCDGWKEYPQHMFPWKNMKNIYPVPTLICSYGKNVIFVLFQAIDKTQVHVTPINAVKIYLACSKTDTEEKWQKQTTSSIWSIAMPPDPEKISSLDFILCLLQVP